MLAVREVLTEWPAVSQLSGLRELGGGRGQGGATAGQQGPSGTIVMAENYFALLDRWGGAGEGGKGRGV